MGADLGCGAPARVYPDAWSRDTPNWETQQEERAKGVAGDSSFWYVKESEKPQTSTPLSPTREKAQGLIGNDAPFCCVAFSLSCTNV